MVILFLFLLLIRRKEYCGEVEFLWSGLDVRFDVELTFVSLFPCLTLALTN